jgi:hypothetical protein
MPDLMAATGLSNRRNRPFALIAGPSETARLCNLLDYVRKVIFVYYIKI